jgi:hypothetical protein
MKKIVCSLLAFSLSAQLANAQFNFAQIQNQQTHNLAAAQLPSLLGDDIRTGEVFLLNPSIGFANNFISAYDIQKLSGNGALSNTYIDDVLRKIPKQGTVWAGADIPLLNVFFNINKKNHERFLSFGLGMREKIDFNFSLNKDLLSLLYKGNKQFAGSTVNLSPSLNFLFYNEYFLAAAGQFQLFKNDTTRKPIIIKPALRLRYLNGMASIYMSKANIDMYTDPEGRYINFNTLLEANMSSAIDTPDIESALGDINLNSFKGSGKGFGIDLGVGVTLFENLQVHAALIDIGSIHFKRNTINYTKDASYTYDGIDLNNEGETINTTQLNDLIQPDKTYNAYKQPLPTRLILSGFYGLGPKTKRRVTYYMHNISLVYVQGFRNYLNATTKPTVNIGYAYNIYNMVNTGIGITVGGLNKIQAGAQLGFRLGAVKLGFASNNLLPIITAKAGRGTDFNMWLGFYF